jgi:hypothetical protein
MRFNELPVGRQFIGHYDINLANKSLIKVSDTTAIEIRGEVEHFTLLPEANVEEEPLTVSWETARIISFTAAVGQQMIDRAIANPDEAQLLPGAGLLMNLCKMIRQGEHLKERA